MANTQFEPDEYHAKLKEVFYANNINSNKPNNIWMCHNDEKFYNSTNTRIQNVLCDVTDFFAICLNIKQIANTNGQFDKQKFETWLDEHGWVLSSNIRLVSKNVDVGMKKTIKRADGIIQVKDNKLELCNYDRSGDMLKYNDLQLTMSQWGNDFYVSDPIGVGETPCGILYTRCNKYNIVPYGSMNIELHKALDKLNINYNADTVHFSAGLSTEYVWVNHTIIPVLLYTSDENFDNQCEDVASGVWNPENPNKVNAHWTLHINGDINPKVKLNVKIKTESGMDKLSKCVGVVKILSYLQFKFTTSLITGGIIPTYTTYKFKEGQINVGDMDSYHEIYTFDIDSNNTTFTLPCDEIYNLIYKDEGSVDKQRFVICCHIAYNDNSYVIQNVNKISDVTVKSFFIINKHTKTLPHNFIDNPVLPVEDIARNIYTYPMGFEFPYSFDTISACNDGFTGNPEFCHANGDTIAIKFGSDGTDDDPDLADDDDTPKDDIIQDDDTTSNLSTASGTLTTTYKIDEFTIKQIGGFLWRKDIASRFELYLNNPIENLLSIKMIPIDAPANSQEPIVIGNVDLETIGGREVTSTNVVVNIGTVNMSQLNKYGNFIDLPPYTKYVIYLPYIGFREFDGSCCLNKSLNVRYSIDLVTGACLAMLYVSDKFKVAEYEGNIGIDIPISASNRGNTESAIISGLADASISLNPVNIPSAIANSVFAQYSYQSKGAPSPTCLATANRTCYILIDRPQYTPIKSFAHTKGLYCNKTKYIDNCKGFTICDSNIDLTNIPLTSGEIDELRQILSSGFYA